MKRNMHIHRVAGFYIGMLAVLSHFISFSLPAEPSKNAYNTNTDNGTSLLGITVTQQTTQKYSPSTNSSITSIQPIKTSFISPDRILAPQNVPNATADNINSPRISSIIAADDTADATPPLEPPKTVLINFNNVSIIEYIRFVSRISNRNFVFDENDLQFNVTIISEEPATIDNIMTALLQELMIHDLILIEDGNNFIIHKNAKVNAISKVVGEDFEGSRIEDADIITQVFRLNTLDPERAAAILRPLASDNALIESLKDSNHLIVTDLSSNVEKISQLIKSIDAPNSGMVIGQYVSQLTPIDVLIPLVQQIMQPISQDQALTFVSHAATNSIFIVSSPFLVERTIAVLQYLDQEKGATRIFNLRDLKMGNAPPPGTRGQGQGNEQNIENELLTPTGEWLKNSQGNWIFKPRKIPGQGGLLVPPSGRWNQDANGNWNFTPGDGGGLGGPNGHWVQDPDGNWVYELYPGETFSPQPLSRQFLGGANLPGGVEKKTQFYIYRLQFRKGDTIETSLRQIADTVQQNERGNEDLIITLRSVQWLSVPNSLVFSGTAESLEKARALTNELDSPMRQVFIEMLILETTLSDSLEYGVAPGSRFGGGNTSGSQAFFSGSTPLLGALDSSGLSNLGGVKGTQQVLVPDGTRIPQESGFTLGIIGQKITHCGTEFGSIGAVITAIHDRTKDEVISNPKLLVEDNSPAEIFVGLNTPYRTQSIANNFGTTITSNYEYRDVGTRLKVTPYLGNGDIIELDIEEEVSTIIAGLITNAVTANTSPGPTTRINRTTTRVHIPDTYFLIISGMIQDEESRERNQLPCLGGVPLLGALFSDKKNTSEKRNLMIFIRPKIIDTEDEVQCITKHQQDIYDYYNCLQNSDNYETTQALDYLNIGQTLYPEDAPDCFDCDKMGLRP